MVRLRLGSLLNFLAATLVLSVFFFSCATVPEEPVPDVQLEPEVSLEEETYQGVSTYAATGDPTEAIAAFERAKREDPDDPETRVLYSSLLLAVGRFAEAKNELEDVLEKHPDNINAMYTLSLVEGALGNRQAQEQHLQAILALDEGEPRANATLGELYLQREEYGKAKNAFERSIASDPENFVARHGYGNVLRRTESYRESLEQFNTAAGIDPDYSFVYADRARSRLHLNDPSGAEKDLGKAIEVLPNHYWHHIDRGKVRLIDLARPSAALEDFNRAIEINPELFYAYAYRGGIYIERGRYDEARADLVYVHEQRPDYYPVYPELGMLFFLAEEYSDAREMYLRSIEQDSEDPGFRLMAGVTYYMEGNPKKGGNYFKDILSSFSRDSTAYHVARTFVEPGYEKTALRKVREEREPILKNQMFFYLGLFYLTHDKQNLGETLLLQTAEAGILSLRETRIARELLSAKGVNE